MRIEGDIQRAIRFQSSEHVSLLAWNQLVIAPDQDSAVWLERHRDNAVVRGRRESGVGCAVGVQSAEGGAVQNDFAVRLEQHRGNCIAGDRFKRSLDKSVGRQSRHANSRQPGYLPELSADHNAAIWLKQDGADAAAGLWVELRVNASVCIQPTQVADPSATTSEGRHAQHDPPIGLDRDGRHI